MRTKSEASSCNPLKRPFAQPFCAQQIYKNSDGSRSRGGDHRFGPGSREQSDPTHNGNNNRNRVEPHAKWKTAGRPTAVQQNQPGGLDDELDDATHREDGTNHVAKRKPCAEENGHGSQREQGNMGEMPFAMEPRENGK